MLGPFATASCLTPIHQVSLAVLSRAACASMSTTTTTTTTRDRGDRYGPMEWAQKRNIDRLAMNCRLITVRQQLLSLPFNTRNKFTSTETCAKSKKSEIYRRRTEVHQCSRCRLLLACQVPHHCSPSCELAVSITSQ